MTNYTKHEKIEILEHLNNLGWLPNNVDNVEYWVTVEPIGETCVHLDVDFEWNELLADLKSWYEVDNKGLEKLLDGLNFTGIISPLNTTDKYWTMDIEQELIREMDNSIPAFIGAELEGLYYSTHENY